jgi:uncharacterized membrane protein YphA (DoxX/SURF4 family)
VLEAFCKDKLGPLSLRLALGLVCVYHGYLKIMATGGTTWYPAWPVGWQLLVAWGEFTAGLAILVGFRCRLASAMILIISGCTFVLWQGWNTFHLPLRTLEPTLLLLLIGLALMFFGAGELSIDGRTGGKLTASKAPKKK